MLLEGSGANYWIGCSTQWGVLPGLCSEDSIPNIGRGFSLDTKFADLELTLSNPMHQFNAADRNSCTSKPF